MSPAVRNPSGVDANNGAPPRYRYPALIGERNRSHRAHRYDRLTKQVQDPHFGVPAAPADATAMGHHSSPRNAVNPRLSVMPYAITTFSGTEQIDQARTRVRHHRRALQDPRDAGEVPLTDIRKGRDAGHMVGVAVKLVMR